jgi:exodeoxyribonuclease VII large subunit
LFQGPSASAEIRQALTLALRLHDEQALDAIVIIRGGGSAADLAWLNDEELARAVCRCPLPVITGIGHEPDNTILDEVAARRCDTPSKVAQLILTTLAGHVAELERFWRDIRATAGDALHRMATACDQAWDQTQRLARRELDEAVLALESAQQHISNGARQTLFHREQQITLLRAQCHDAAGWRLQAAAERVEAHWAALRERGGRQLAAAETACGHLIQVILALGPKKTLRRGYAYLRQGDRVVTRQAEIAPGTPFMIHLQDGVLPARREP